MLRGIYSAAAGMIAQQRRHDTVTNNISNINTPGYKQEQAVLRSFPELLISQIRGGQSGSDGTRIGKLHMGVFVEENIAPFIQGELQQTNNPFDFALYSNIQVPDARLDGSGKYINEKGDPVFQPQALFTLINAAGETRYSLNGKFTINGQGQLISSDGSQVMGISDNPIVLMDADGLPIYNFTVTKQGQFIDGEGRPLQDTDGNPIALLLSKADNPHLLVHEGNGLYRVDAEDEGSVVQLADDGDEAGVFQGFYERSNVDPTQSIVDMMSALRLYEANQKVIQFYDRSLEKTVNEVGKV